MERRDHIVDSAVTNIRNIDKACYFLFEEADLDCLLHL